MALAEPREAAQPRTYGNFTRAPAVGLFGLGWLGTWAFIAAAFLVVVLLMIAGPLAGAGFAVVIAGLYLLVTYRDRHQLNLLDRSIVRLGWWSTLAQGLHLYRSGPLGRVPWGTHQLPGIASTITVSEYTDAWSRPFALLEHPGTAHYTVVLASEPDGAALVDAEVVDMRVSAWGHWLADLADMPGLRAASVTVETGRDSGAALRSELRRRQDPHAPAFAQAVLEEIADSYHLDAAAVRSYVALTFSAATSAQGRRRRADEVAADIATRLPYLTGSLAGAGAGTAAPLSAQELCEVVRVAYDPACAPLLEQARANGQPPQLSWDDVGPSAMQAGWDALRHDSGLSRTWAMTLPPRGNVQAGALAGLLEPHSAIDRKRVTLLYRPFDHARAAEVVEKDVTAASFRLTSRARARAKDTRAARIAAQSAAEEASGAGVVRFGMLITATVLNPGAARDAFAAVEARAAGARVQVRPVYGSQASAFSAALPLGLVLRDHVAMPAAMRESL